MLGRCVWHTSVERRLSLWKNLRAKMRGKRKSVFHCVLPSPLMQLGCVVLVSAVHQTVLGFCLPGTWEDDTFWSLCGWVGSHDQFWSWIVHYCGLQHLIADLRSSNALFSKKRMPHSLGPRVRTVPRKVSPQWSHSEYVTWARNRPWCHKPLRLSDCLFNTA